MSKVSRQWFLRSLLAGILSVGVTSTILNAPRKSSEKFYDKDYIVHLAKKNAEEQKLEWRILYGIWKVESQLKPKAKGDKVVLKSGKVEYRSWGLGQLNHQTANRHERVSKNDLLNAETNARISAKELKLTMKRFNDDPVYGIAAYNTGPDSKTLKKQYKSGKLPFNYEKYVKKVLTNALSTPE